MSQASISTASASTSFPQLADLPSITIDDDFMSLVQTAVSSPLPQRRSPTPPNEAACASSFDSFLGGLQSASVSTTPRRCASTSISEASIAPPAGRYAYPDAEVVRKLAEKMPVHIFAGELMRKIWPAEDLRMRKVYAKGSTKDGKRPLETEYVDYIEQNVMGKCNLTTSQAEKAIIWKKCVKRMNRVLLHYSGEQPTSDNE